MPFWKPISYHFPMNKIILLVTLLAVFGCGKSSGGKLYKVEAGALEKFVNQKAVSKPTSETKTIVNNEYPIEIALFSDGRFYYDLPNLGDGRGRWTLNGGVIELKAKRTLFDMYIEVMANDPEGKTLSIQFTDRFGPNTLQMMNNNI